MRNRRPRLNCAWHSCSGLSRLTKPSLKKRPKPFRAKWDNPISLSPAAFPEFQCQSVTLCDADAACELRLRHVATPEFRDSCADGTELDCALPFDFFLEATVVAFSGGESRFSHYPQLLPGRRPRSLAKRERKVPGPSFAERQGAHPQGWQGNPLPLRPRPILPHLLSSGPLFSS